jgi:hypothetical protein
MGTHIDLTGGIMKRISALLFTLVVLSTALAANAQTRIQFYSTFAKGSAVTADCNAEAVIVGPLIAKYHGPAGWTWIIACDEEAWHRVEKHTVQDITGGRMVGGTDRANHFTYIRGYAITHPFDASSNSQPDHIIAHELGHILADTSDEAKAEKKARELLNEPTVIASRGELR